MRHCRRSVLPLFCLFSHARPDTTACLERHRDRQEGEAALSPQEETAARTIVTEMGGLPLALEQAGAYIAVTQCSFSDYLHLFQVAQQRLLDEHEPSSDHPLSVVKTFELVFQRLEQQQNEALCCLMRDFCP